MSRNRNKTVLKDVECTIKNFATYSGWAFSSMEQTVNAFRTALLGVAATAAIAFAAQAVEVNGAGAAFPYPIYATRAEAYPSTTGPTINYHAIGPEPAVEAVTPQEGG